MKRLHWAIAGALIVGILSGPSALEQGAAAQPPIAWRDIPFSFLGGAVGMLFVIGIQLVRRNPKPSQWALYFLGPVSVWLTASGLSAALLAFARDGAAPYAFLLLSVGMGALLGVWVCWLIFRLRYANQPV